MKQQENNFQTLNFFHLDIFRKNINNLDFNSLIDSIYQIKNTLPSILKSNYGGYQSPNNLQSNSIFFPLIQIFNSINTEITGNPNNKITSMWVNISSFGNWNAIHTHAKESLNLLSGIFYLKTPKNSGKILFHNPIDVNHTLEIEPKEGDILFFNSILPHMVAPNQSNEDRISIAFNYG